MSEPFLAEIRILPFNFSPWGWAFCDGQVMPISQNTALFSLLGITYGGNGQSTFVLPDFRGRAPMHPGHGPGLSNYILGSRGGSETVSLLESQIPFHSHEMYVNKNVNGDSNLPKNRQFAVSEFPGASIYSQESPAGASLSTGTTGGGASHNNMQPYLKLNFCIALYGIFPQRS